MLGPDCEVVPVGLCIQPVGDGWAAMGLATEVLLPEPGELSGLAFFGEIPEEAEQKAREQLGTPAVECGSRSDMNYAFLPLPGTRGATACLPGPSFRHAGHHRRWSGMPGNCGIGSSLRSRGGVAGSPVISSCAYPMARYARRRRSNIFSSTGTARST